VDEEPLPLPTVQVLYSCRGCGLTKTPCAVVERGAYEDVKHWFEEIMLKTLILDHTKKSPLCQEGVLSEVMIPIAGANRVGEVPRS
jgi:hypothetical protein